MEPNSGYDVMMDTLNLSDLLPDDIKDDGIDYPKIKRAVLNDIQRANDFYTSKVEPVLRLRHQIYEADRAYYKKRFANTGAQSDFVSYDFWSVVQWAIPMVMNSFFGGDDAVVIVGRNEEDVPRAEVLKSLINFQLMTQNKGFLVLWDWFSDAFQYNIIGAVKIWWERDEDWQEEHLDYVDAMTLLQLQMNEWCKIEYLSGPDILGNYQVGYRIGRLKSNKPILEPVRVTDLRWSPEAKSLSEANFVAHRQAVSADHLRRQARAGVYDEKAVEKAIENASSGGVIYGTFETELNDELDQRTRDEDSPRALYELYECYVKVDINGDGLLDDPDDFDEYESEHQAALNMAMQELATKRHNEVLQYQRVTRDYQDLQRFNAELISRPDFGDFDRWFTGKLREHGVTPQQVEAGLMRYAQESGGDYRSLQGVLAGWYQEFQQERGRSTGHRTNRPPVLESPRGSSYEGRRSMDMRRFGDLDPDGQAAALMRMGIV